jgi:hypothetical protein
MEVLSTAKAAERLEVDVQRFHRLVAKHDLKPIFRAEGKTGAMFWSESDVDRLAAELAAA